MDRDVEKGLSAMPDDRRVPRSLRAHAPSVRTGESRFPGFEDYLARGCGRDDSWVVVAELAARGTPVESENLLLWSALISKDVLSTALASEEWEDAFDSVGYPSFWVQSGQVIFEPQTVGRNEVALAPFSIYRSFHDYLPPRFDLAQDFVLYHELVEDGARGVLFRVDEDGQFIDVVRIEYPSGNQRISVERSALLDYLSAHGAALVRYHDFRAPLPSESFIAQPTAIIAADERSIFRYQALAAEVGVPVPLAYLHGKDAIVPPEFPMRVHRLKAGVERRTREFVNFTVAVDSLGNPIEETSNGSALSSYFRDTGREHYLTAVWFRAQVLEKYYRDRRYRVETGTVSCLDLWSIDFDRVDDDFVQVWLGDLGRIPTTEQQHWRGFVNVPPPTIEISRSRYETDFGANFAEPGHNPLYLFKRAFEAVQVASVSSEGSSLFLPLSMGDEHLLVGLHIPFTDDAMAFDEQTLALAKLTADSIDVPLIERATGMKVNRENGPFPLDVLEQFLVTRGMVPERAAEVVKTFRAVQRLRSSGAAHRKGDHYAAEAARLIPGVPSRSAFRSLLELMTSALDAVAETLRRATADG